MADSPHDLTELLIQWSNGNEEALKDLMPLVYGQLRRVAAGYLRHERPNHTLESAAVVNEAYLRLIDQRKVHWENRAHFFGIAAHIMREILVDHARSRQTAKRGRGVERLEIDEVVDQAQQRSVDLIALDEALSALEKLDPQKSRVVELRFFGGLSIEETAEVMGLSAATVKRHWVLAKGWLHRAVSEAASERSGHDA
jgi:RNA polymerase sigma factor (TIGR02999 family)